MGSARCGGFRQEPLYFTNHHIRTLLRHQSRQGGGGLSVLTCASDIVQGSDSASLPDRGRSRSGRTGGHPDHERGIPHDAPDMGTILQQGDGGGGNAALKQPLLQGRDLQGGAKQMEPTPRTRGCRRRLFVKGSPDAFTPLRKRQPLSDGKRWGSPRSQRLHTIRLTRCRPPTVSEPMWRRWR